MQKVEGAVRPSRYHRREITLAVCVSEHQFLVSMIYNAQSNVVFLTMNIVIFLFTCAKSQNPNHSTHLGDHRPLVHQNPFLISSLSNIQLSKLQI